MPALAPEWTSRFVSYVKQYAGVPKFSSTVTYIRDLHVEKLLGEVDTFNQRLEEYRQLCADLHRLSSTPLDPQYQRLQQQVQVKGNEITAAFPAFQNSLSGGTKKVAQAFANIEQNQKYLTQNRRPAADLLNIIKALDTRLVALRDQVAGRQIGITLDEIRRAAGDNKPIVR